MLSFYQQRMTHACRSNSSYTQQAVKRVGDTLILDPPNTHDPHKITFVLRLFEDHTAEVICYN